MRRPRYHNTYNFTWVRVTVIISINPKIIHIEDSELIVMVSVQGIQEGDAFGVRVGVGVGPSVFCAKTGISVKVRDCFHYPEVGNSLLSSSKYLLSWIPYVSG